MTRKKTENNEKLRLATLKRLKRSNNNELERNLRLENMIASKQLGPGDRKIKKSKLENDAATKWLRLVMETDEVGNYAYLIIQT